MADANNTRDAYENLDRIVPGLWGTLIPIGVIGNGFVLYIILRFADRRAMACTNWYIINLALTDLLFIIIAVPSTMMHYVYPQWTFGVFICKFHMYMIYVTMHATCMTLTAMTIDRYYAIVHPVSSHRRRTPKEALIVSAVIWLVSFLICIPVAIYHGLILREESCDIGPCFYCEETWPSVTVDRVATVSVVFTTYVIPLTIIITCYSLILKELSKRATQNMNGNARRKRKATKLVAVVVVLFATFWLPIHVFWLWFKLDDNFPTTVTTYVYKMVAHTLSYILSCINPFVYSYLGDGFRKGIRKAFPRVFRRHQLRGSRVMRIAPRDGHGEAGSALHLQVTAPRIPGSVSTSAVHDTSDQEEAKAESSCCLEPAVAQDRPSLVYEPRPECSILVKRRSDSNSLSV